MRKKLIGSVASDKRDKTIRVEIELRKPHPKYGKIYRDRTTCYVHDENNESKEGDRIQIIESAPMSKKKRWTLVKVVEQSNEVDVAAMKAARKLREEQAEAGESAAATETAAPAEAESAPSE